MKKVIVWFAVWAVLFLGASHVFAQSITVNGMGSEDIRGFCTGVLSPQPTFCPVTINTGSNGLYVVQNYDMQPFGVGAEDSDTAELHVQGTFSPQVTLHGLFIQGSLNQ